MKEVPLQAFRLPLVLIAFLLAQVVLVPGGAAAPDMGACPQTTCGFPTTCPHDDLFTVNFDPVPPTVITGAIPGMCVEYAAVPMNMGLGDATSCSGMGSSLAQFVNRIIPQDEMAADMMPMTLTQPFVTDLNLTNPKGGGAGSQYFPTQFYNAAFVARFRGYLKVPADWVGKDVYFGFVENDGIEFILFESDGVTGHPIIERPAIVGTNYPVRLTQRVRFNKPGLYPVELHYLYINPSESHYLEGRVAPPGVYACSSYEEYVDNPKGCMGHGLDNFTLLSASNFYQSDAGSRESGTGSCQQCDRTKSTLPSNNSGPYCNRAGINDGISCLSDAHCSGNSCNCCAPGTRCLHVVSDNYYTPSAGGVPSTSPKNAYICAQCLSDSDCSAGAANGADLGAPTPFCDTSTFQCVSQPPSRPDLGGASQSDQNCGVQHVSCPASQPYCVGGNVCVQCRDDLDCQIGWGLVGNSCLSGQCIGCNTDFRCGPLCHTCPGPTPFCQAPTNGQTISTGCVRCVADSQCPGGQCVKAQCVARSTGSCPSGYDYDDTYKTCVNHEDKTYLSSDTATGCTTSPQTPYAYGDQCVECYTASQCPCGKKCVNNQCDPTPCADVSQCNGNQCCDTSSGQCYTGSCDVAGPAPCCSAAPLGSAPTPGHAVPTPLERHQATAREILAVLLLLGAIAVPLYLRRRRTARGTD